VAGTAMRSWRLRPPTEEQSRRQCRSVFCSVRGCSTRGAGEPVDVEEPLIEAGAEGVGAQEFLRQQERHPWHEVTA
jgi:hypothetical protein